MRVGVVKQFRGEGYQAGVVQRFDESVELLKELGAEIVELDCPSFDLALSAYYLIAPSECSSNLARFDAMRYGLRIGDDGTHSAEEVTSLTREAGFGAEVKRRIMLGTYALSSGYYDAYYGSAQKVRTLITRDFEKAFEQVDVIVSPDDARPPPSRSASAPTTRWRCTSRTCAPSRPTWRATPPCRCPAASRRRTACRSACRSSPRR